MSARDSGTPPGWVRVPLGDVADLALGKMLDKAKRTTGARMPYLRNINVRWHSFDLDDVYEMPFEPREIERYSARDGDVMICEGGEPGRAAVWQGPTIMFQKAIHRVRPRDHAFDPRWLVWHLRHDAATGRLRDLFTGTTIKHLTGSALARYEILLPSLGEQRRVLAKLEALFVSSRASRAAIEAVPPLLERYRQSVLSSAFRGDLTADWRADQPCGLGAQTLLEEIGARRHSEWQRMHVRGPYPAPVPSADRPYELPTGWRWASLEQLTSAVSPICYGVVQPGDETQGGVPLVRVCDIDGGRVHTSELRSIAPHIDADHARSRLRGGEVLVTVVGTIGRVAVAPIALAGANIARAVARLCPIAPITAEWLSYALMTHSAQSVLTRESREVARKTLNIGSLAQVLVPVAPMNEMAEIVQRVMLQLTSHDEQLAAVTAAGMRLDMLEQSILQKAFQGKLLPRDAAAA